MRGIVRTKLYNFAARGEKNAARAAQKAIDRARDYSGILGFKTGHKRCAVFVPARDAVVDAGTMIAIPALQSRGLFNRAKTKVYERIIKNGEKKGNAVSSAIVETRDRAAKTAKESFEKVNNIKNEFSRRKHAFDNHSEVDLQYFKPIYPHKDVPLISPVLETLNDSLKIVLWGAHWLRSLPQKTKQKAFKALKDSIAPKA